MSSHQVRAAEVKQGYVGLLPWGGGKAAPRSHLREVTEQKRLVLQATQCPGHPSAHHARGTQLRLGNCGKPGVWGLCSTGGRKAQSQTKLGLLPCVALLWDSGQWGHLNPYISILNGPISCFSRLGFHTNKRKFLGYFKFKGQKMEMGEEP